MRYYPVFLVLIALVWVTPASAQAPTLDFAHYERLLREARAAAARGDRLDVLQVVPALTTATTITLPDGTLAPVDNRWLAAELAKPAPDLPMVAARLGALLDALATRSPPAPPEAIQRLDELLARPPFEQPTVPAPPREPNFLERFIQWLFELFGNLVEPVGDAATGEPGTAASWLLTALGAALVIAVLTIWLRGLRRTFHAETTLPSPAERAARDTAEARAQAAALARTGDYRGAARLLALAALLWLDEGRVLPYDPHQTNREHLGRLRERPTAHAGLRPIVETADRVWYGGAPLDATGYAEVERQVEALHAVTTEPGS